MDKEKLINAIEMDKSDRDEREESIKTSSYTWAHSGGYFVLILLILIRWVGGEPFVADLFMILMGQMIFMTFFLYINNKEKKSNLYFFIATTLLFLGFTYNTLVYYGII